MRRTRWTGATCMSASLTADVYADGNWLYPAEDREVMVLHTLTVDPDLSGRGIGRAFAQFYEDCARQAGCTVLRIDTNERNIAARHLYASLGYREADIVLCDFNRIPKIHLVLLEKKLETREEKVWQDLYGQRNAPQADWSVSCCRSGGGRATRATTAGSCCCAARKG